MEVSSAEAHESCRLAALHQLKLLDTPPEERFDRITRLARRVFDVPIALVSMVDADRQWFKSRTGLAVSETSRAVSFCTVAIQKDELFVVPDTLTDPRFRVNPLVTGEPHIRFYAGCPLHGPGGYLVGTLCLIDRRAREFSDEDRAILRDLAATVEQQFEHAVTATVDPLTGLTNRRGLLVVGEYLLNLSHRNRTPATLLLFDLNDFKDINDTLGHAVGDRALSTFARALTGAFRTSDVVARLGGDEFCVLMTEAKADDAGAALRRFDEALLRSGAGFPAPLAYSVGIKLFDPGVHRSVTDLIADADQAMYAHKSRRRELP